MSTNGKDQNAGNGGGLQEGISGLRSAASKNPAADKLLHSAEGFLGAQSQKVLGSIGDKIGDTSKRLADVASGDAEPGSLLGKTAKNVAEGDSPAKAGAKGVLGGVKDKVKGAFSRSGKGPGGGKSMNIVEDVDVGVPVRDAYNRWTQFAEFSKWAKGVQSVSQDEPTKSSWNAKIFLSKRNWNSTITEQIPDQRIAWTSEGPKGSVDGVVTFHPLGENLTKVLLVLQYYPGGLFEKTGNVWRAQGRRARLDLKLYRRFVMMTDEEVEGWRGEIRDSEVTREHDEVVAEEEGDDDQDEDEDSPDGVQDEYDDDDEEDDEDEEPEDADEDDEGYQDEYDDEDEEPEDADEQPEPEPATTGRRRRR